MRKKIFTLLTLMLAVCSGAWADATLISYSVTGSSDLSTTTDGTWTENTASGTPGGTCSLFYRSDRASILQTSNVYYYRLGGGDCSMKLTLSGENTFQTGDEVSVTYYGSTDKECGFYVRTGYKTNTNQVASETTSTKGEVFTKTVALTSSFNGLNTIYIERFSATMCVSTVKVTRAVSYTVTAQSNNDSYGTVETGASSLKEGATTTITATPVSGYKVTNWTVSGTGASIDPYGDSNSLTTTLTMGTANATVTCTFAAASTYTISYATGSAEGVSGSRGSEIKTEDVDFTLPSSAVFTRSGYVQSGWNTNTDGTSGTHYNMGGIYTANASQTFYPEWSAVYSVTYDGNGAEDGSVPTDNNSYVEGDEVTVLGNTGSLVKSGFSLTGWNTKNDGTGTNYAVGGTFTMGTENVTLYAQWAVNDYTFTPTGEVSNTSLSIGDEVTTSVGGKMFFTPVDNDEEATLKYAVNNSIKGLEFGANGKCAVTIELNQYMQPGTVINLNMYCSNATARGLIIATSTGTNVATFSRSGIGTYDETYTVQAGDGLAGTKTFMIKRNNNAYLQGLSIINCLPLVTANINPTYGYATFSSTYALDFSEITTLKAYIATSGTVSSITLEQVEGTVKEGTGLVIKGETASIPAITSGTDYSATNKLWVWDSEWGETVGKANNENYTNYVLSYQNGQVVFAPVIDTPAPISGGQAVLTLLTPSGGARPLTLSLDDDVNGIDEHITNNSNIKNCLEPFYNLAGQRVAQPTKGLYIVNGKKVLIK